MGFKCLAKESEYTASLVETAHSPSLFSEAGLLPSFRGGTCDPSGQSEQHISLALMIGSYMQSMPTKNELKDVQREFWGKDAHSFSRLEWILFLDAISNHPVMMRGRGSWEWNGKRERRGER